MINVTDKKRCSGCHACAEICPTNCIEMILDNEGFLYPSADSGKCTGCGLCEKTCPVLNPAAIDKNPDPAVYAAYNKNEKARLGSASGGIFPLFAEHVINNGGVVFGACFDENSNLVHSYAETYAGTEKFCGSKYVQSIIGNAYSQTKNFLEEGRQVLFTGTPCQINGLLSFLKKDYPGLYTHDFICHGVPSPKVWKKYVGYREKHAGASVESVSFRGKDSGWRKNSVKIKFNNNTEYKKSAAADIYMKGFLSNLYLRPSCGACSFKTIKRKSDVTLADFWGADRMIPEFGGDKGLSLLFIHSEKGQKLFGAVKNNLSVYGGTIDAAHVIKHNASAVSPSKPHAGRQLFFADADKFEFDKLIKKYCKTSAAKKIKKFLSEIKNNVFK